MWKYAALVVSMVFLVGCGGYGDIVPVSGTVTLDGEPLPNATVRFTPIEGNRPVEAVTDASGNYKLRYTRNQDGAERGKHRVSITTGGEKEGPNGEDIEIPEKVPAKYNTDNQDHIVEVGDGEPINFDLKS